MFLPYSTEVVITRWPISNIAIIALCVIVGLLAFGGGLSEQVVVAMILNGWSLTGLIGHQLLHANWEHLLVNMLYLWVFGNAVCETVGNTKYLVLFFALGVFAAIVHNICDGTPAIGASGALNGIIGFYLIFFPINRVSCFYWFFVRAGVFDIAGYWLITFWFAFDAWGAFSENNSGIAYWAHIGGFLSGAALGVLFERKGWAQLATYDNPSLIDYIRRKQIKQPRARPTRTREQLLREYRESQLSSQLNQGGQPARDTVKAPCPYCHVELEIPTDLAGQKTSCPSCGNTIEIET